jgi:two-component system sensor histidine kinase KdpD
LLALRELALRRAAERVEVDVREHRRIEGIEATWPTAERILVAVGAGPGSARLIRAACRMAAGLRASWTAAYVDGGRLTPLSPTDRARLASHLRLAESLGGDVVHLAGGRISASLIDHARRHDVTRILVGKPTHSRWRDRLRGSIVDEVVRGSGDIPPRVRPRRAESAGGPTRSPRRWSAPRRW